MKPYRKVAVFGGTFSPVHNGHIKAMEAYAKTVRPDILYIIPTAIPPHKIRKDSATDAQRLKMLNMVAEKLDVPCKVYVSDMEILRGGVSYTCDTVFLLRKHYKEVCIFCGTDMLLTLDEWRLASIFLKHIEVAYMQREEDLRYNSEVEEKISFLSENYGVKFVKIEASPIEISSSEIRSRVQRGEDISELVPLEVAEFIRKEGLYISGK